MQQVCSRHSVSLSVCAMVSAMMWAYRSDLLVILLGGWQRVAMNIGWVD